MLAQKSPWSEKEGPEPRLFCRQSRNVCPERDRTVPSTYRANKNGHRHMVAPR